ncbi:MAG: iron-sulfur cluster-binding protein [Acidobacteria bacterium]|nr:iron-sulfur cluster-binding protein [Acidobacteriota bacterium]
MMKRDGEENVDFVGQYRAALSNPRLQSALAHATTKAAGARISAAAQLGDEWERLRERARALKEHTVEHLDHYLEEFALNVERHGGRVFWARDAEEANRYIVGLAGERGVRLAVKGKSMMSEEVGLNRALSAAGVEAVETDLGEYIVQLAGERPSHINMPAIHLSRADVSELFEKKLKTGRTEEIGQLAAVARRLLRARFAAAQMGITGVNFAVAETGTIVLVENEGNIRLTTSLPRIHVALMGIEKIIPRFADLEVFLALLSRSASGQKLTSNVSLLTGVKSASSEGGQRELHVVILDNGRVEMLANPRLRESLFCIRCGACLNVCPVYQKIGGHAYGWTYSGPIGAVLTPQLVGRERAADLPFASTLCGACHQACPVKINIPDMLLHLRYEIAEPSLSSPRERVAGSPGGKEARRVVSRRGLSLRRRCGAHVARAAFKLWGGAMKDAVSYGRAARLARWAVRAFGFGRDGAAQSVLLRRWTATRSLPVLAAHSFRERWPELPMPSVVEDAPAETDPMQPAAPPSRPRALS